MNKSAMCPARLRRVLGVLLCAVVLCGLLPLPRAKAAATQRTVKVGVFSLGQFQYLDEDGSPGGYNAEYLAKVASITHWKYEYVPVQNWVEATAKLEAGEIDLLAPAQKIASLEETFDYAVYSMGTEFAAIYTLSSREDLLYEDFNVMAGLKFGGAKSSTFTTKFLDDYAVKAGFTPDMTLYDNTTALFDALYAGEVDAVVTNIMFAGEGLKLLGRFHPMPVYYITTKGNEERLNELDDAMTSIRMTQPSFEAELMSRYFPVFDNTQFTYAEQQFATSLQSVTVGYEVNHAPLSYTDENGEFAGITRDLLDLVSEKIGIAFTYVPLPATNVTYDYLRENGIYVLSNVEYNDQNSTIERMHLSSPYLESEKVIVARSGLNVMAQLDVALATGSGTLADAIAEVYPNVDTTAYATVEECFDAVIDGTADATLQNRYVAESQLTNPNYADLSVMPVQTIGDRLCMATLSYDGDTSETAQLLADGTFLGMVDKAVRQLTTQQINSSIIRSTAECRYKATFGDFAYRYRYNLAVVLVLLAVCFALLFRARHIEAVKNQELAGKNSQLADAVQQAEKANRAKSQFLSRMSHEIRTPMNAIVGITAIAKHHETDPEKINDYLDKIDSSSKVLLNIINDVLDMSAIESDKLKIASAEFDMKQILNGIKDIYYAQCKTKGIDFDMDVDLSEETLIGDSLRVNQILLNLVSNAYKFTDKGGSIRVTVKQTEKREDKVFLRFVVADTGCGMTHEMLARLFKPFEQESATTAQKHGGSGLGMSITKNLIDMMHGAINVESEKGKGTTFTVDLPFALTKNRAGFDREHLHEVRALVVDDDRTSREYTALVLERIGVQYEVSTSGEDALVLMQKATAEGKPYDICFVDMRMPGMNGIDVTKKVRELFSHETLVIIVSAYDLSEVEDEAKSAGADMFVSKPLFQSTVFNVLMRLSGGRFVKESADPDSYDFTGHRVLLAEDNELNSEIAIELLGMVNMAADHAENGQKAVEMFNTAAPGTYDVILMDVQMPVMDGHEAARAIRALSRPDAKTIPIYAMTANAFTEDVAEAISSGMNGHIAKPIDTAVLYRTLKKAIDGAAK